MQELIKKAQEFNETIETPEDLLNHIERVQTCCGCGLSYYDKICPECQKKIDNTHNLNKEKNNGTNKKFIKPVQKSYTC